MQSKEFLCDLRLMFDALSELANLSQQLQAHSVTLLRADHLLKRTIRVLASFKDTQGEKLEEALTAQALGHLGSVPLESNAKLTPINAKQFLQSLINNLEKHLSFDGEMLHDLSVLDTGNWPSTPGIRHEPSPSSASGTDTISVTSKSSSENDFYSGTLKRFRKEEEALQGPQAKNRRIPQRLTKEKYALGIVTLFPSLKDPHGKTGYVSYS
ncbi:hypothetical protein KUCAC02_022698 [Chaenocephalus aceratus]|uniref:Uncharacterized protein n=1 Tax=Chaenocephalus aceratus TaxID=36190 RepID=A0ACB9XMR8_CHAAC|nr:hypothetical protein KUCAC02_022698 [Chaenocephalus aceratus]